MFATRQPARLAYRNACLTRHRSIIRLVSSLHKQHNSLADIDSHAIPVEPVWSVKELLSSYPKPIISAKKLKQLHELSALIAPEEGSQEHAELTAEMEDLVKLVEAVRLVDTSQSTELSDEVPDGRIWAEDAAQPLTLGTVRRRGSVEEDGEVHGQALLKYASRTENHFYVVDADRKR